MMGEASLQCWLFRSPFTPIPDHNHMRTISNHPPGGFFGAESHQVSKGPNPNKTFTQFPWSLKKADRSVDSDALQPTVLVT